jgi:hypothetical protein
MIIIVVNNNLTQKPPKILNNKVKIRIILSLKNKRVYWLGNNYLLYNY